MAGAERGCHFTHPKKCYDFIRFGRKGDKGCLKGDKCEYYHPPLCHGSATRGVCSREKCKFQHLQGTKKYSKTSNYEREDQRIKNHRNGERLVVHPVEQVRGRLQRGNNSHEFPQETVQTALDPFLEF